jgi:predicted amidohydrolase YtcJ
MAGPAREASPPSIALVNGTVMTMDPTRPRAEGLVISGGRIAHVGDTRAVERTAGPGTRLIDLAGRTVIPGLVDAHVHLATDAAARGNVDVRDLFTEVGSVATLLERLRSAAAAQPQGSWVAARGSPMQAQRLAEGRLPTRPELDMATPLHPAYVTFGAHVLVANSAAIAERGIGSKTLDPDRGVIERHPVTGELTGVFYERAGMLIKGPARRSDPAFLEEAVLFELERCLARGVTTIHDVVADPSELDAYRRLRRAGRLPARVAILVRVVQSGFDGRDVASWDLPDARHDGFLWPGGVKMSIDGGFTGGNAAFSEPIRGRAGRALIRVVQSELDALVERYDGADMRVAVHAMGDLAVDMALTAYERRTRPGGLAARRHRIEHLGNWLCTPDRLARARRLGIVPVPNPSMHHYLAAEIASDLGPHRSKGAFDLVAIAQAGLPVVTGSDGPGYWPIDVLRDISVMASRRTRSGAIIGSAGSIGWEAALRAQTATAAWLGFREADLGCLKAGMSADLAILAMGAAEVAPDSLSLASVDMTIVDGHIAYERGR